MAEDYDSDKDGEDHEGRAEMDSVDVAADVIDADEEKEMEGVRGYDPESGKAWDALVTETLRQHSLSVDTLNSTMQRIGIMLAFTPILFIEAVKYVPEKAEFIHYYPALFLSVCFIVGISAIFVGRSPAYGARLDTLLDFWNEYEWIELQDHILNDTIDAHYSLIERTISLRLLMDIMAITLLFGALSLVIGILGLDWLMSTSFLAFAGAIAGYTTFMHMKRINTKQHDEEMEADDVREREET